MLLGVLLSFFFCLIQFLVHLKDRQSQKAQSLCQRELLSPALPEMPGLKSSFYFHN